MNLLSRFKSLTLTISLMVFSAVALLAQPCYTNYDYRLPVYLDNSSNAEVKKLQVQLTVNTSALIAAGKMQSSGQDIRILDRLGSPLNFYVEDGTINTASTKIWVLTDSIIGFAKDTLYMFYGNSSASSVSSRASTFDLYDDFSGSSLGVGWTSCGSGTVSVSGGKLTLSSGATTKATVKTSGSFSSPVVVEMSVSSVTGGSNYLGTTNTSNEGYGLYLNSSNMGIHKFSSSASCYTNTSVNTAGTGGTTTGVWEFRWDKIGSQFGEWPGGTSSATDSSVLKTLNDKIIFGNFGGDSLEIDWIRARKYTANNITSSVGTEVTTVYTINPSYNSPICEGEDLKLTVNEVVGATYHWTGPTGSGFTSTLREPLVNGINPIDVGQYQVEVRIPTGCASQIKTVMVEIFPASSGGVVSSVDTAICTGVNFGTISLEGHSGNIQSWQMSEDNGANWFGIANRTSQQFFHNIDKTRLYRAVVQNGQCAADTSTTIRIDVAQNPVPGIVEAITEECTGSGNGHINLNSYYGQIEKWQTAITPSGPWIDQAVTLDSVEYLNPTQSLYYRVQVSSGACGKVYSSPGFLRVYETTDPGILFGGGEVCDSANTGAVLLQGSNGVVQDWELGVSPTGPWTSTGYQGPNYSYINLSDPISVRAKLKNGVCPVAYTTPVSFVVNPRPSPDFATDALCENKLVKFTDQSSISSGSLTEYFWSISDGYINSNPNFLKTFLNPGKFQINLTVQSDKECTKTLTRTIDINASPLANYRFTGDIGNGIICTEDSIGFRNLTTGPAGIALNYAWDFGDGTTSSHREPKKRYTIPEVYEVKLKVGSADGCADSLSRFVTVFQTSKPDAGADATISKGINYQLIGTGGVLYNWSPAQFLNNAKASIPVARIEQTTEFVLETVDYNGCVGRDSVILSVADDYIVRPNNVITPEGNGENDVWIIQNIENYPNNAVSVFDRWGREIYSAKDYQNDWGATELDGTLLLDGTYYYVLSFDDTDIVYKGAITVIRNN